MANPNDDSAKPRTPPPAGDDAIVPMLKKVSEGLTYPSETDAPFDVFCWRRSFDDPVKEVEARVKGGRVRHQPVDEFFTELVAGEDGPKFQQLRSTLESVLSGVCVFRHGEVEVQVYLIGRTPEGNWVGLHTLSVET